MKKSAAARPSYCAAKNVFHGVRVRRSGAGSMPSVVRKDRVDRVAGDVVAEEVHPAADARVAPGRVLRRHADHERGDVRLNTRATGAALRRAVVLVGHASTVPAQDGVGGHDAGDVREAASAEDLPCHGQAASRVIGEAKPVGTVRRAEDQVLLAEVVNDRLLLPVDPAGEEQDEDGERRLQRLHADSVPEARPRCKGSGLGRVFAHDEAAAVGDPPRVV